MTASWQKPVLTEVEPKLAARILTYDDEMVDRIVEELGRPTTDRECVRTYIEYLREDIEAMGAFAPDPDASRWSDERKNLKQIYGHARKLAFGIKGLSPRGRYTLALLAFFHEKPQGDPQAWFKQRLDKFVEDDLLQIAGRARQLWRELPDDPMRDPKDDCAEEARLLMRELSLKPTKGAYSKYYVVAQLMWEAVTGEEDVDMKRACDRHIDLIREAKAEADAEAEAEDDDPEGSK